MSTAPHEAESLSPTVETFLLGPIELLRCVDLQRRLVEEVAQRDDGRIVLLLAEHPTVVSIGRGGSPDQVARQSRLLRDGRIEVHWIKRGGPCMVHCPGQLAIYPIVPLRWHGLSVGEYLERFQAGIIEMLDDLGIRGHTPPGRYGVWGRTGQLATLGIAVRHDVAYHGAFLNVAPAMGLFRLIEDDSPKAARPSCLVTERGGRVKMTTVRATLVRHLADAFGCDRYHLYTGHPLLRETR